MLEVVFIALTIFFMYKIARISSGKGIAILASFAAISLLFTYYEGGNLTEEYSMAFIAIAIYIFADYFINGKINRIRLFACGFAFAGTLCLRPNMIAIWVVMCIAVLLKSMVKKETKNLVEFIIFFLLGALILIIPIIIWLGINGALVQCWQDYIVFNRQYISAEGTRAMFTAKWNSFFTFFNTNIFIMAFILEIYICMKERVLFNISYLAYMIVSLLFLCLSGMTYGHYGMILIPAIVYPLSRIFNLIKAKIGDERTEIFTLFASLYLISVIISPSWVQLIQTIPSTYLGKDDQHFSKVTIDICNLIDSLGIEDGEAISVYGNWDIIYVLSKRPHATRYSYQFPIGQVMPSIMEEYWSELKEELPRVIVVRDGNYDEPISQFLENNGYTFIWGQNSEIDAGGALVFYRE